MSVDKLDEHLKANCDLMKELVSQALPNYLRPDHLATYRRPAQA